MSTTPIYIADADLLSDAAPVLADMGLPFRAGLDDIISLVPLYGDIAAGVLQLYQVWLAFVFGIPIAACVQMVGNGDKRNRGRGSGGRAPPSGR